MQRVAALVTLLLAPALAAAQAWPVKPVRLLIGFTPGGTSDVSGRLVGEVVTRELGQTLVIENRPGSGGALAIEIMARAPKDGYTLGLGPDSTLYRAVIDPQVGYRVDRDLAPVAILTSQPIVIAVHPAPGWKSVADLLRSAKARPGEIIYALPSATGTQAVAASAFFGSVGVKLTSVSYKGGGQAVIDLIGGQIPVAVLGSAPVVPHAKTNRIRLLAVTSKARSKALPDVPSLAELGYGNIDFAQWFGVVAPAGTPPEVIARLSRAFNRALADPVVAAKMFEAGLEVVGGTPDDMARRMSTEIAIWGKAAKEANLVER